MTLKKYLFDPNGKIQTTISLPDGSGFKSKMLIIQKPNPEIDWQRQKMNHASVSTIIASHSAIFSEVNARGKFKSNNSIDAFSRNNTEGKKTKCCMM